MPYSGDNVPASRRRTRNAARPPSCRYSCRMSGVLAKKLGRKYSRRALHELLEILLELAGAGAPGEIRVRLGEADFRQVLHALGARERFGQEDDLRVAR